jgi:hypothetical protein
VKHENQARGKRCVRTRSEKVFGKSSLRCWLYVHENVTKVASSVAVYVLIYDVFIKFISLYTGFNEYIEGARLKTLLAILEKK